MSAGRKRDGSIDYSLVTYPERLEEARRELFLGAHRRGRSREGASPRSGAALRALSLQAHGARRSTLLALLRR